MIDYRKEQNVVSHTYKLRLVPFAIFLILVVTVFLGYLRVLMVNGPDKFNAELYILFSLLVIITGILFSPFIVLHSTVRVTAQGIEARDMMFRRRLIPWNKIIAARYVKSSGALRIRIFEDGSRLPIWFFLSYQDEDEFLELLSRQETKNGNLKKMLLDGSA